MTKNIWHKPTEFPKERISNRRGKVIVVGVTGDDTFTAYVPDDTDGFIANAIKTCDKWAYYDDFANLFFELQTQVNDYQKKLQIAISALNKMKKHVGKETEFGKLINETIFYLGVERFGQTEDNDKTKR